MTGVEPVTFRARIWCSNQIALHHIIYLKKQESPQVFSLRVVGNHYENNSCPIGIRTPTDQEPKSCALPLRYGAD